jgi:hypothetical protein
VARRRLDLGPLAGEEAPVVVHEGQEYPLPYAVPIDFVTRGLRLRHELREAQARDDDLAMAETVEQMYELVVGLLEEATPDIGKPRFSDVDLEKILSFVTEYREIDGQTIRDVVMRAITGDELAPVQSELDGIVLQARALKDVVHMPQARRSIEAIEDAAERCLGLLRLEAAPGEAEENGDAPLASEKLSSEPSSDSPPFEAGSPATGDPSPGSSGSPTTSTPSTS